MRTQKRIGFTLVELLVVITIISMLMALLMPAVQSARESARRATCLNNEYQIGRAMLNFESAHNRFPGYREHLAGWPVSGGDYNELNASWVVVILPLMEQNELYSRWSSQTEPVYASIAVDRPSTMLEFLECPSGPLNGQRVGNPHLGYVVNAGIPNTATVPAGSGGAGIVESAAYGVFHDHSVFRDSTGASFLATWGGLPYEVGMDYLSTNDGSSNTLLLSENLQATTWAHYTSDNPWTSDPLSAPWEAEVSMVWWPLNSDIVSGTGSVTYAPTDTTAMSAVHINADKENTSGSVLTTSSEILANPPTAIATANNVYAYARPSSRHPGGVNTLFCDGHTQFLSESIDYKVYCHLMTPNGKKAYITGVLDAGTY